MHIYLLKEQKKTDKSRQINEKWKLKIIGTNNAFLFINKNKLKNIKKNLILNKLTKTENQIKII